MQTVGEKLRKARLEKNISLDEAYKQTKIHLRVLEALEQDRAHNFLSFIYIKGFLKSYAQYLELDSEELLKEYIDSQKVETPLEEKPLEKKRRAFPQLNLFLIFRLILVLVLSLILILYFRFLFGRLSHPTQKSKSQKVKVEVTAIPAVKTDVLVLEVRTKDACWMRVKTDNQVVFAKTLSKGKSERWQARDKIELRIGKPEVLEVFLNGKPIDLEKAQVKRNLLITREGIEGK